MSSWWQRFKVIVGSVGAVPPRVSNQKAHDKFFHFYCISKCSGSQAPGVITHTLLQASLKPHTSLHCGVLVCTRERCPGRQRKMWVQLGASRNKRSYSGASPTLLFSEPCSWHTQTAGASCSSMLVHTHLNPLHVNHLFIHTQIPFMLVMLVHTHSNTQSFMLAHACSSLFT